MAGLLSVPATRGEPGDGWGAGGGWGERGRGVREGPAEEARGPRGGDVEPAGGRPRRPGRGEPRRGRGLSAEGRSRRPRRTAPRVRPGRDQRRTPGRRGAARRRAGGVTAPGKRSREGFGRAPGVWPCARPCALAGAWRERLHGCCVGRPVAREAAGWGNPAASFPAGGGPVREVGLASRTVRERKSGTGRGTVSAPAVEWVRRSWGGCRSTGASRDQTGMNRLTWDGD